MKTRKSRPALHRVRITNVRSLLTHCGFGEGRTLQEAQAKALQQAKTYYAASSETPPHLSEDGWEVLVDCRVLL